MLLSSLARSQELMFASVCQYQDHSCMQFCTSDSGMRHRQSAGQQISGNNKSLRGPPLILWIKTVKINE